MATGSADQEPGSWHGIGLLVLLPPANDLSRRATARERRPRNGCPWALFGGEESVQGLLIAGGFQSSNRFCSSATVQADVGVVGASCLTIPGVNSSVRIGPRSEVTTSSTSTVLNISSASSRSPAALRVS